MNDEERKRLYYKTSNILVNETGVSSIRPGREGWLESIPEREREDERESNFGSDGGQGNNSS